MDAEFRIPHPTPHPVSSSNTDEPSTSVRRNCVQRLGHRQMDSTSFHYLLSQPSKCVAYSSSFSCPPSPPRQARRTSPRPSPPTPTSSGASSRTDSSTSSAATRTVSYTHLTL